MIMKHRLNEVLYQNDINKIKHKNQRTTKLLQITPHTFATNSSMINIYQKTTNKISPTTFLGTILLF